MFGKICSNVNTNSNHPICVESGASPQPATLSGWGEMLKSHTFLLETSLSTPLHWNRAQGVMNVCETWVLSSGLFFPLPCIEISMVSLVTFTYRGECLRASRFYLFKLPQQRKNGFVLIGISQVFCCLPILREKEKKKEKAWAER